MAARALRDRARRLGIDAEPCGSRHLVPAGRPAGCAWAAARGAGARPRRVRRGLSRRGGSRERATASAGAPHCRRGSASSANPRALAAGFLRAAAARGARAAGAGGRSSTSARARRRARPHAQRVPRSTRGTWCSPPATRVPRWCRRSGHRIVSTWAIATPPPAARAVAGPQPHLGGQLVLSLPAHHRRWARAVRRRRCGNRRCGAARCAARHARPHGCSGACPQLLPQVDARVAFAWSGSFGASADGLPSIGAVPGLQQLLRRAGLRRQRHHLLDAGRADAAQPAGRRRRAGPGPGALPAGRAGRTMHRQRRARPHRHLPSPSAAEYSRHAAIRPSSNHSRRRHP